MATDFSDCAPITSPLKQRKVSSFHEGEDRLVSELREMASMVALNLCFLISL